MKSDLDMTAFFVGMINENGKALEFLIDGAVPKVVLLGTYNLFLRDEVFVMIELLPKEEKEKLVEKCRSTGLEFTNESLREAARILYTLEFINGNT